MSVKLFSILQKTGWDTERCIGLLARSLCVPRFEAEQLVRNEMAAPALYEVVCQLLEWADKPARERRIGLGPILERALKAKSKVEQKGGAG
jgi:hypothetical protein